MRTDKNRFLHLTFIFCLILIFSTAVYGQNGDIPADAVVTVVGGGGYPVEDESIYNGGGMDDFGAVYSASRDLFISLKDVYITDNLTVITLTLGQATSSNTPVRMSLKPATCSELPGQPPHIILPVRFLSMGNSVQVAVVPARQPVNLIPER